MTRYVLGVDIGGTFTDAFLAADDGLALSAKAASTPPNFGEGFLASLEELSKAAGLGLDELLAATDYICHGTTSTLNAVVTGDVAKVGLLTTRGHRDAIFIQNLEGRVLGLGPEQVQDMVATDKPSPLIPRQRALEVTERVDQDGDVIVRLNEEELLAQAEVLVADGVAAIAVSFLWSFVNDAHERRARELIQQRWPTVEVGLSSEISPRIREFPRTATTIINLQIAPILRGYLEPLEAELQQRGLTGPLLVMQGSGGAVAAPAAPRQAVTTIGSVLTGGTVGSVRLAEELGDANVIATDIGGTTFLVGLIVDGRPLFDSTTVLNGTPVNVPAVRVNAIGSGGGAISWLDDGRNLRVGPRSAGARPGPACYGQGGMEPTNTDANLVLGILDPDYFLGGRAVLRRDLADKALAEHIGGPLGLSVEEAAMAVFAIQNGQTADLVRKIVLDAGQDPRDFTVYAFGGAGPIHCHAYSADLGIGRVVVPLGSTASAFSAFGLASSDVTLTFELSDPAVAPVPPERVNENFAKLEARARLELCQQGVHFGRTELRREVDARYTAQMAEVATPVPGGKIDGQGVARMIDAFEERYAARFGEGTGFRAAGVQFITYRVFAHGILPFKPRLVDRPAAGHRDPSGALKGRRPVCLDTAHGYVDTPVYDVAGLAPGHVIEGPALIEAATTTVVVGRDSRGTVDRLGNLVLSGL